MKTSNVIKTFGCCLLAFVSMGLQAQVITNPGFETQAVASGGFLAGDPTGWTGFSNASSWGLLNPTALELTGKEGNNVAFLNVASSPTFTRIKQTVASYAIQDGDTITLSFLIGAKTGSTLPSGDGPFGPLPNYDAVLMNSSETSLVTSSQTNPALVIGSMVTWTRTYEFNSTLNTAEIGQSINIGAFVSGSAAEAGQVVFDDFSLSVIPEPSVAALFGLAGLAFICGSRRRRAGS